MFKGLGQLANLGSLLKQAQNIGSQMQGLSEQLKGERATGSAGGGLVEVEVNGLGEVIACRIDADLIAKGDGEMIEDLLPAAFNQAHVRSKQLHAEAMKSLTEGMELPGLDDVLAQINGDDSDPAGG
ncbi:MAG: YbaB/EbfC family nucleoid-associated protein [Planctomycetes bacterium]|nr:YbaB/EbfC family nucleoid-associated protein [Planctomycetota bacterium]